MYTEEVIERFKNPKFSGVIENPDGKGEVGNKVCGDVMVVFIKIKNDESGKELVEDIKFQTFGCVSAIASSDMLCELAKGKTLSCAEKITRDDVSKALGGLPQIKEHCSNLAADALQNAIKDYKEKQKI
ncbi:iron-sulfur cluster assembly scaffold protein [Candidatus Woesearchaeota archaeon]|mgnify:CR=1 FL=1|jgi:nitrogen fixation protein NifU and related proteins|nr:iron-sulfur cluster assembly scaffold protein [Candidatus Woesearchaeota archaeon]